MKNKILPIILFLSLIGQTAFSQKRFSQGLYPYTENLPHTMVKSMHRAGFEVAGMAALTPSANNVASTRNVLQLDSTKTFYGYGLNGVGDSTPLYRTIYAYPQPNTKIETEFEYINDNWLQVYRATLTSDDQERLVEVFAEAFDAETQTFIPDSRIEVFPHGDSPELIDSAFTYLWDSTILDWHIILSIRNKFDAQDERLVESFSSIDYFGDPVIFQELYSYDANGDNHLIEEFAILGSDVFPSSRTDLMYVDHRPIEVLVSISDGISFFPQNRTNYAYTLFGAVRKQMNFEWDVALDKFHLGQTIDYSYDNAQRLSAKETALLPQNAHETRERILYAYVEDENLYLEWGFVWNDDLFDWLQDSKKYYYYDGLVGVQPSPVQAQNLEISPNPTSGLVQLKLDGPALIQVYDAHGAMVGSAENRSDNLLNLIDLPSGLYFITARSENEQYVGRLIKE
ncbi:MAG: T9SS type A sorting domain-containing protein [Lewinellaceae bacterium]|nr:T9SS type A sorting domain-containing protein [Lewinellaceae bacterium]